MMMAGLTQNVGMMVPAVSSDLSSSTTVLCYVKVRHMDFLLIILGLSG